MKRFAGCVRHRVDAGKAATRRTSLRFDPAPEAMTVMQRDLGKNAPDAALLAVDGGNAALVKPYLGTSPRMPADSCSTERRSPPCAISTGSSIVEIPWLVTPSAAEFAGFAASRLRQRGAGPPVCAGARRVSHREGVASKARRAIRARRRHRPRHAGRGQAVRARRALRRVSRRAAHPARWCPLNPLEGSHRAPRGRARRGDSPPNSSWRAASSSSPATFARGAARSTSIARDGETLVFVEVRLRRESVLWRRRRQHHRRQERSA